MKPQYIYMNIIAPSFNLLPVMIALFRYRNLPAAAKTLFAYLVLNAVINTAASVLAYHHISNTPLFHFSTVLETIMLLFFFRQIMPGEKMRLLIIWLLLLFPAAGLLNLLFLQHLFEFNSYILSLQSIIIIALSFIYLWLYENHTEAAWSSFPLNWILSGLLLYFSSAFILFTFSNFIIPLSTKKTLILIWNIHATLTIFMYVLIAIGYTKYKS